MSDVFISYARANEASARLVAEVLRQAGYGVWRDDAIPAHRPFAEVIEERLRASKAVLVLWSRDAAKSHWVQSEADLARSEAKLVQMSLDGSPLPMPFDRIQCEPMVGWSGDALEPGFQKILASLAELVGTPAGDPGGGAALAGPPQASEPQPRQRLALPSKPSIAVMPFANLSPDPEQDYFAEGMMLEIIEALSRFRDIFVIDSASTRSFEGRKVTARDVARELGVRYVVEGQVRKAGGRVRIGIQLIDGILGTTVWTQKFEDTLADVFALQDEVALAVAGRIEPTINAEELKRAAGRATVRMDSYDLYLRGHAISRSHSREATFEALELLDKALELDPDFGLALVRAAHCHRLIYSFGWSDDPEHHRARCLELARRALQVAGDDATVLTNVSYILMIVEGDDATALALVDRAIEINPGHARMFYWSGRLRLVIGDTEGAIEHLERSMRLDPVGPLHNVQIFGVGLARFAQGRFEEALAKFRQSGLARGSSFATAFLAACHAHLGQMQQAAMALGLYQSKARQPIEEMGRTWLHHPDQLALFLDGIARVRAVALETVSG